MQRCRSFRSSKNTKWYLSFWKTIYCTNEFFCIKNRNWGQGSTYLCSLWLFNTVLVFELRFRLCSLRIAVHCTVYIVHPAPPAFCLFFFNLSLIYEGAIGQPKIDDIYLWAPSLVDKDNIDFLLLLYYRYQLTIVWQWI